MKPTPTGYGLGLCPCPWGYGGSCQCNDPCAVCGNFKHSGIHMHALHGKPGDPPFGHEFISKKTGERAAALSDPNGGQHD